MNEPPKPNRKTFWSKAEAAGEGMELGFRLLLGIGVAIGFAAVAWILGSFVWVGLSLILAVIAFPVGFLVGFFLLEVKLLLQFVVGGLFE